MNGTRVQRGMHVVIGEDRTPWIVLERHPDKGHWWLHRWVNDAWESSYARYTEMKQVFY